MFIGILYLIVFAVVVITIAAYISSMYNLGSIFTVIVAAAAAIVLLFVIPYWILRVMDQRTRARIQRDHTGSRKP